MSLIHTWQRVPDPSILWRPPILPTPTIFKFCPNTHHLSPHLLYLSPCFFNWMGDCITSDVLFYLMISWIYTYQALVPWCHRDLVVCFMQQGVSFLRSNTVWSFASTLIWYHTHKGKHHTQGPIDWHTHINTHQHHLLCAHSSYLYYIQ